MKKMLKEPAKALTLREEIKELEEQQAKLKRQERIYCAIADMNNLFGIDDLLAITRDAETQRHNNTANALSALQHDLRNLF